MGKLFLGSEILKRRYYNITGELYGVSLRNNVTKIHRGDSYSTLLVIETGHVSIADIIITMNGVDITESVYDAQTVTITIPQVTGDIHIYAVAILNVKFIYKWLDYRTIQWRVYLSEGRSLEYIRVTLPSHQTQEITPVTDRGIYVNTEVGLYTIYFEIRRSDGVLTYVEAIWTQDALAICGEGTLCSESLICSN